MKKKKKRQPTLTTESVLNKRRIITLFGEIDEKTSKKVIKELIKLDHVSNKPITLLINSPGGHCPDGLAIIDTMRRCGSIIKTEIIGEACSMAGIISVCGDARAITENAFWMAHPMSAGTHDYKQHLYDYTDYIKVLDAKIEKILRAQTKLTSKEVDKYTNGQLWLDAEQALNKGIVDEILGHIILKARAGVRIKKNDKKAKRKTKN